VQPVQQAKVYLSRGQSGNLLLDLSLNVFDPNGQSEAFTLLSALLTDRAMEAWYHLPIA
jgi:hypothetical protein